MRDHLETEDGEEELISFFRTSLEIGAADNERGVLMRLARAGFDDVRVSTVSKYTLFLHTSRLDEAEEDAFASGSWRKAR